MYYQDSLKDLVYTCIWHIVFMGMDALGRNAAFFTEGKHFSELSVLHLEQKAPSEKKRK